jgi:hypothetical protein
MKKPIVLLWLALGGLFIAGSYSGCTDITDIGADLLDEDRLGLDYVDTISLIATTVTVDSVLTQSGTSLANQLDRFMFGDFNDPVMGRVDAGIYVQPLLDRDRLSLFAFPRPPSYKNAILDSIVLVLTLDSAGFYGKPSQPFGLEVLRVIEDMDASANYYSNVNFATSAVPLGSAQFSPTIDSITVFDYANLTVDTLKYPHLRIPLSNALGQELIGLDSSEYYKSDTSFLSILKGLYIRPTQQTDGLAAFNWSSLRPGIFLYYTNEAGLPRQYQYEINEFSARMSRIRHDYSGSPVVPFLNDAEQGKNLLFAQALAGPNIKIEIPHATALRNAIINYAELEIPVIAFPGDDSTRFVNNPDVYLTVPDTTLAPTAISDFIFAGNNRVPIFGGVFIRGADGKPDRYRMNISSQLSDMAQGRAGNVMYLQIINKAQRGGRIIFAGPENTQHKMRIKVAFTKR